MISGQKTLWINLNENDCNEVDFQLIVPRDISKCRLFFYLKSRAEVLALSAVLLSKTLSRKL